MSQTQQEWITTAAVRWYGVVVVKFKKKGGGATISKLTWSMYDASTFDRNTDVFILMIIRKSSSEYTSRKQIV